MTIFGNILFWGLLILIPIITIIAFAVDDKGFDLVWLRVLSGFGFSMLLEILFILIFALMASLSFDESKSYIPIESTCVHQRIYSNLTDANSNFLILIASENGYETYNYFIKNDNNVFILDKVKSDNFNIVYSDTQYPYIEYHTQAQTYPTMFFWIWDKEQCITLDPEGLSRRGTIYLPNINH